jgi:hypothetical protein
MIRRWWKRRREQRDCFHHDRRYEQTGSWVESMLIDLGRRKMFWCTRCDKTWIV